ncbi:tetratricopeptide repeat protein [Mangrovibacillus cuniculi]|uniref:Tetratricopeptide repeat protein n=1 Tax=Mangrovibacillus cuniculi TaxID=2593652 RepID=A0A7S8CB16_9BACI|nr:tetratricopeptide repeat protein [Mangrovibacillus cuniculi]QPC46690.1 tetratricopeptide repeat protein [Mangrovibacillus cuniculi]
MIYVQRMIDHLERGQMKEAKEAYEVVRTSGTDDEKYALATELKQLGFLDEAMELYRNLLELYPKEGELLVELAETLMENSHDEEALSLLNKVDKNSTFYIESLLMMADLYQADGLLEVSEQKLIEAKGLVRDEPVIDFALGEIYLAQGKFLEAIRSFEQLINQHVSEFAGQSIHEKLAEALSAGGSFEAALPHYEKAIKHHEHPTLLFQYAITCYHAKFYEKSAQLLETLLEQDKDFHSAYLYLANSYEHEEQITKALEAIKRGVEENPFQKELFLSGGKLALKSKDEVLAENWLREAIALDPEYVEALIVLTNLFLLQESPEEVIQLLSDVDSYGDTDPQLQWTLAKAYNMNEEFSQALNAYEGAYNELQHDQEFLVEFAGFLLEEGQKDRSVELLKKVIESEPEHEDARELLERLQ